MNTIELLNANKNISDYRLTTIKRNTYELFFVHEKLETVRATDTKDVTVTVYHRHDGKIGEANFNVLPNFDETKFNEELSKAINNASSINNEDYKLVENASYCKETESNFVDYDISELASQIAKICFETESDNTKINALEIFIEKVSRNVVNSKAIDKTQIGYSAMIEAIPTYNGQQLSVELYEQYHFGTFDPQQLRNEMKEKMNEVEMRYSAEAPKTRLACPVIFRLEEFERMLQEITGDLNYGTVYNHANKYTIGSNLQEKATKDLLTLTMSGQIDGSSSSSLFDGDGTDLNDVTIIENGVVVSQYGNNRFAQYLEKPNTGNLQLMKVKPGTTSTDDIMSKPHLEIVSTSGLMADLASDYVGGEVRLAYYFDGEKTIPITGISISSTISAALNSMTLSSQLAHNDTIQAPEKVMFDSFEIL